MPSSKKQQSEESELQRAAGSKAELEAAELVATMRALTEELSAFLDAEQKGIDRRGVSSKRLARLRLMAEDLQSASKFASKSIKS